MKQTPFKSSNTKGAIGETGNLFLIDQGFFSRPFYNDVYGKTDKQLTGAMQVGWNHLWNDSALESRFHWLAITPTFREHYEQEDLETPVGHYADWIELQESWSKLFYLNGELLKIQLTLGIGHIGDHGIKNIHRDLHQLIGSSLDGLDYTNQPEGITLSGGFEVGLIEQTGSVFGVQRDTMISLGYFQNKFMWDFYLDQHYVFTWSQSFKSAFEIRLIRQTESSIYDHNERLAWRFEMAFGIRSGWWKPSIKHVSPYLRGDQIGQTFLDPLGLYFRF